MVNNVVVNTSAWHAGATGSMPGRDFAFQDNIFVKVLLAMLPAWRLVGGSKHAPSEFDSATWQAGASSD